MEMIISSIQFYDTYIRLKNPTKYIYGYNFTYASNEIEEPIKILNKNTFNPAIVGIY